MPSKANIAEGYEAVGLSPLPFGDGPAAHAHPLEPNVPLASLIAENRELAAEVTRLRAERDRWNDQQRRLMELLNSKSPDRIIHDLRNVLNERELFRTLADLEG